MHLHEFTLPSENIVISDDEDVYGWREWYDEKSVAIDEFLIIISGFAIHMILVMTGVIR